MLKGFYYLAMTHINLKLWVWFGSNKGFTRSLQYYIKAGEIFKK